MKSFSLFSKRFTIGIITAFLLLINIISTNAQILVGDFPRLITIKEGEEAILNWNFQNADKVEIEGVSQTYAPEDKLIVHPLDNTIYKLTASSNNSESININIFVMIDKDQTHGKIKKGTILYEPHYLQPSLKESLYFNGLASADSTSEPTILKIMKTKISKDTLTHAKIKCLILDKNGNHILGYSLIKNNISIEAKNYTNGDTIYERGRNFHEVNNLDIHGKFNISIVLDNSAGCDSNSLIIEAVKDYISGLTNNDYIMFSFFNQDFTEQMPLTTAEKSFIELEKLKLPEPSGLNAMNKAVFKSISRFDVDKYDTKALVLITYGSDNSSIIFTANDAANIANGINLPIYVIGVGNAVISYQLRYLCGMTGGSYYQISKDEIGKIYPILNEITVSQKAYYEFDIPISDKLSDKEKVRSNITMEINDTPVNDAVSLILWHQVQFSQYQILSTFDKKTELIKPEFEEIYKSVAEILKENPSAIIELIGHGGGEGTSDLDMALSKNRADEAKRKLMDYGASPNQIKTRGDGTSKPLYYIPLEEWQNEYNRRVEIRWLYPSMMPYELIAAQTLTEEDARRQADIWEERNLKSYFDRYIEKTGLVYRIKLWGYRTYEDAEKAARELKRKYKKEFVIE